MEMGLLRRYAPFMELSSRMYPRPAPQLPLWIRHNPRGGQLVSHGDCRRQDNWGVPLSFRFLASAASSVSSVSARPQYFPVLTRAGCHRQHPSSATKDLLQNSARAQWRRLFCKPVHWLVEADHKPGGAPLKFNEAINMHKMAVENEDPKMMLQGLANLKEFAKRKGYCDNKIKAKDLVLTVLSPLGKDQLYKHGGGLGDGVVKESLEVVRLLLQKQNAPEEIRIKLYKEVELKPILENIRDYGGSSDEVIKLANEILAEIHSTPM